MSKPACDQGPTDGMLRIGARCTPRHRRRRRAGAVGSARWRTRCGCGCSASSPLSPEGEVCVCDFVEPLAKSQPTVSHHLKVLSEAGLVQGDRRGKWVWYSLNRDRLAELRSAIDS